MYNCVAPVGFGHGHDRPPVSNDWMLPTTTVVDSGLALTLSATDVLIVIAFATIAKLVNTAALRTEGDNFTLGPAISELFMATFRSQEIRDRASTVSVSQERPSLSGGVLENFVAATPVPLVEVPPLAKMVPAVEVLHAEVPLFGRDCGMTSEEATGIVGASEDDNSSTLNDFISKVMKDILSPLADKPPLRRRVDPPCRHASSVAFG